MADSGRRRYGIPYAGIACPWGPNSSISNRVIGLVAAGQIDRKPAYRGTLVASLGYILGRNSLDRS